MTPLSDALTAAQRSALAALEKAYVAGQVNADEFTDALDGVGINDSIDCAFLLASLDVLREWGVSAPTMTERVAETKVEQASQKQWDYIYKLCEEKKLEPPPGPLYKEQASAVIDSLQAGSYDASAWDVPF